MDHSKISNPFDNDEAHTRSVRLAILGLGLLLCCSLAVFGVVRYQPNPVEFYDRVFPSPTATYTRTPTATPTSTQTPTSTFTPHILLSPSNNEPVLNDALDSNVNSWTTYYSSGTSVRLRDEKLYLESDDPGYVAVALCAGCPRMREAFYFQAEVIPAEKTSIPHGLAFCISNVNEYYVFEVDSSNGDYYLLKNKPDGWDILINRTSNEAINRFPRSNILAVLFRRGRMDLYVNGSPAGTFTEENPWDCHQVGIFVDGGGVAVIADNVYAYEIKSEAPATLTSTPTP